MTTENLPRSVRMRLWMRQYDITDRAVAEKLGLTPARVTIMLNRDTMPTVHHAALLQLGFPASILPQPYDRKSGPRRRREPRFPGLMAAQ